MKRTRAPVLLGLGLLAALGSPALAADSCLDRLSSLPPRTRIHVLGTDGSTISGRLLAVDPSARQLRVAVAEPGAPPAERTLSVDVIQQLQYRARGRTSSHSVLLGALAGGAAGFIIGSAIRPGRNSDFGIPDLGGGPTGALGGIGAGLLLGMVLPQVLRTTHTIRCSETPNVTAR